MSDPDNHNNIDSTAVFESKNRKLTEVTVITSENGKRKMTESENSVGKDNAHKDKKLDKKLDKDEDKRNPQYIPRKGTFYEHDDRTMVDGDEMEGKENGASKKWIHDLYNEEEQQQKSTKEIVDTYGYDIRNEEAPPTARRYRRYGRGPNKYTRNWKDDEAYTRAAPQRRVFHNNKEEFPDLGSHGRNRNRGHHSPDDSSRVTEKVGGSSSVGERVVRRGRGFRGTGKPLPTMEFTSTRGRGPLPPAFSKEPTINLIDATLKNAAEMLVQDFSHISINSNNNNNNIVEETIVPSSERRDGGGVGGSRSKRYSTQRQRSLPETTPPPTYSPLHNLPHYTQPPPTSSERRDGGGVGGSRSKCNSTQRQRSLPETTPPPTYSPLHNLPHYTQPPPTTYVPTPVYNDVTGPQVPMMAFLPPGPPQAAPAVPTPVYNDVTGPQVPMMAFLPPGPPRAAPAAPPYPPLLNYMPPSTFPPLAMQPPWTYGGIQ